MTTRQRQRHLRIMAATAVAAFSLLTTACSGEKADAGGNGTGKSAVSEEANKADQALEHRKCLREQGLKVSEPKAGEGGEGIAIGGEGISREQAEKAIKACAGVGGAGGPKELTQAEKDKALKFAKCMRDNGYDMPDPKFDGSMTAARPIPQGAEKKKFDEANKACASVRP
ncbi:hypothetical protein [Streptomyces sp. NPDC056987]|uniref:hypothetical protein n=1 Tax=Streptomyces sp. NPDC056987 TaxID=3345988 RepID=UPI0036270664